MRAVPACCFADTRNTGSMDNIQSAAARHPRALTQNLSQQLRASLLQHRWLLGLFGVYFAYCAIVFQHLWGQVFLGLEPGAWFAITSSAVFIFFMVNVLIWQFSWLLPKHLGAAVLRESIAGKATIERLVLAAPALLLLGPFSTVFGKMKILIPRLHPFSYDPWLARADAFLHGGQDLWQWLAPWLLNGPAISVLTLIYEVAWPAAVLYLLVHASLDASAHRRLQCLYAYFGTWVILGTLAALAFSSAGPVFFARVVGHPSPYADLMAALTQLDTQGWITPLGVSQDIWRAHVQTGIDNVALSISAMPSLHVAMACLTFLYGRRLGRISAYVTGAYLVAIMAGSVMLGWHYALDGYVAIAGTIAIWWGSGKLVTTTAAGDAA